MTQPEHTTWAEGFHLGFQYGQANAYHIVARLLDNEHLAIHSEDHRIMVEYLRNTVQERLERFYSENPPTE